MILDRSSGDSYATGPSSSPDVAAFLGGLNAGARRPHLALKAFQAPQKRSKPAENHRPVESSRRRLTRAIIRLGRAGSVGAGARRRIWPHTHQASRFSTTSTPSTAHSISFAQTRSQGCFLRSERWSQTLETQDYTRVISKRRALALFGSHASHVEGTTFFCNDDESLIFAIFLRMKHAGSYNTSNSSNRRPPFHHQSCPTSMNKPAIDSTSTHT